MMILIMVIRYLAAPQVAGLAAYLRGLNSPWQAQLQKDPANVKKLIRILHRRFAVLNYWAHVASPADRKPVIWNGEVGAKSCVADYADRATWDVGKVCPTIDADLDKVSLAPGQTVGQCGAGVGGNPARKRQSGGDGGSCPLIPGDGGAGSGGQTLSFTTGPTAAPTCPSVTGCGGRLCTGYYCVPNPTGLPPDYPDPKDPSAGGRVPTTTVGSGVTSKPPPPTSTPPPTTSTPPPTSKTPPPTSTTSSKPPASTGAPCTNCQYNLVIGQTTSGGSIVFNWYGYQGPAGGWPLAAGTCTKPDWSGGRRTDGGQTPWPARLDGVTVGSARAQCTFLGDGKDWKTTKRGDRLGTLQCKGYRDASCYEGWVTDQPMQCSGLEGNSGLDQIMACTW